MRKPRVFFVSTSVLFMAFIVFCFLLFLITQHFVNPTVDKIAGDFSEKLSDLTVEFRSMANLSLCYGDQRDCEIGIDLEMFGCECSKAIEYFVSCEEILKYKCGYDSGLLICVPPPNSGKF